MNVKIQTSKRIVPHAHIQRVVVLVVLLTLMDVSFAQSSSISDKCSDCSTIVLRTTQGMVEQPTDDTLDQFQITWKGGISVSMPDMLAQSFQPSMNILTRVQVLMQKTMATSQYVKLSIRKELDGSDLTFTIVPATDLPTSKSWIEFDFPNISVIPMDMYYIIWAPHDVNMSYVWWGYDNSNFDSYPRGEAWLYSKGTWTSDGFVFRDWCFKTYGYHASQPPVPPSILTGPTEGLSWQNLTFEAVSSDPDSDMIRYGWDWDGDESVDEWTGLYPSSTPINSTHVWEHAGVYEIRVKAEDSYGAQSLFSLAHTVTISNDPPQKPDAPNGTFYTLYGINTTYSTVASDPDNDTIRYGWDWDGDESVDEWTGFYPSNVPVRCSHVWQHAGTYYVQVKAEDEYGAPSSFSNKTRVIVISMDNDPPQKPNTPEGPSVGRVGISYSYKTSSHDPNGDVLWYQFDWDDGTVGEWVGPYASNQTVIMSHVWQTKGSFQVKVKAKDAADAESVWSDPLSITLQKTKCVHATLSNVLFDFFVGTQDAKICVFFPSSCWSRR